MNPSSERELQDVKRRVRRHLLIAVALAAGTVTTIWTSQTDFGSFSLNVAMTLGIAGAQAVMVAAFFMHLLSEKKMICCLLVFTAFFFVMMMGLTLLARLPANVVHYK
jgi:cytochrome c oxidase subunit 4